MLNKGENQKFESYNLLIQLLNSNEKAEVEAQNSPEDKLNECSKIILKKLHNLYVELGRIEEEKKILKENMEKNIQNLDEKIKNITNEKEIIYKQLDEENLKIKEENKKLKEENLKIKEENKNIKDEREKILDDCNILCEEYEKKCIEFEEIKKIIKNNFEEKTIKIEKNGKETIENEDGIKKITIITNISRKRYIITIGVLSLLLILKLC